MHNMKGDEQCIILKSVGAYQFFETSADKHLYAFQVKFEEFYENFSLKFFLQKLGSVPKI